MDLSRIIIAFGTLALAFALGTAIDVNFGGGGVFIYAVVIFAIAVLASYKSWKNKHEE